MDESREYCVKWNKPAEKEKYYMIAITWASQVYKDRDLSSGFPGTGGQGWGKNKELLLCG